MSLEIEPAAGTPARGRHPQPVKLVTRIIGLMSGTSQDGVDAALVEIENNSYQLVRHIHIPYRKQLRDEIRSACNGSTELICRLNFKLGGVFAAAVLSLLKTAGVKREDIDAIASHGQTIHHIPPSGSRRGSTLQIGEASVISEQTGILTISDFRTADMAAGGQGAPLVPMADYLLFRKSGKVSAVLNIGGIANVTIVSRKIADTIAFDIGPGNSLIDEAMRIVSKGKKSFDKNGAFARAGRPVPGLLKELLSHPYFRKKHPKSTGKEMFGAELVNYIFNRYRNQKPRDVVSTLTRLTASSVYNEIIKYKPDELILTGGGVRNLFLAELIKNDFSGSSTIIHDISEYNIPAQAKEALSFAILGYLTLNRKAGNIPSVTGAGHGVILGKITSPAL